VTAPGAPGDGRWADRVVLVTGATGFIGSWLVKELLARGSRVVCLVADAPEASELVRSGDLGRVTAVDGGLEHPEAVEHAVAAHGADTVLHLGAQTLVEVAHRDPLGTLESNVRGTYNLLEACRRHAETVVSVVVASSDKAYGEHETLPYDEETPLRPRHPYETSKACGDLLARTYHHTYGLPVTVTRFGNVYGGGDLNWSRIVPGTIRSLLRGERPVVRSDGRFTRDYVYVHDVVGACLLLAERAGEEGVAGEAFNFGPGTPTSVLDVVDRLRALTGRRDLDADVRDSAVGEIRHQSLDAAKAARVLGWQPSWDLDAGLRETVGWYREFLAA
jgi:CDP-glucose 4,6-dehydratase